MARIRTIKPEFPQSETIGRLSRDARLLFVQLWTISDDEGRTRAASRMLASLLYPYDDDAPVLIDGWLDELEKKDCIRRYETEGNTYLEIINWLKHQKIDHPGKSKIPPYSREFANSRETFATDLGPRTIGPRTIGPYLSEPSSDASKRSRISYSEDFESFWKQYPTDQLMSKKEAFTAWKRLSPDDRTLAARAAPAFRRYCDQQTDYRPVHACRFITQRRFEGFAGINGAGPPPGLSPEDRAKWVREQLEAENGKDEAPSQQGSRSERPLLATG